MGSRSLTEVLRETLALFDKHGAPWTTTEVAERLDLGRRSTYERLERLVEYDRLETKKVGANGRVWWRPTAVGTADRLPGSRSWSTAEDTPVGGITDREISEPARKDHHEESEPLSDAAEECASFTLDPDGCVRTWNPDAEALTGWPEDEILDEYVSTLYANGFADGDGLDQVLEPARIDGHFESEGWCERPSGTAFPVSATITPLQTDGSGISGYTMVLRDETDRRHLEEERRLLANISRTVAEAESFTDGIETALATVCNHTEWACGEAWASAEDGEYLERVVGHAEDEAIEEFLNASESVTFPFGEGLPGRIYASGTPEWIPNASEETRPVFHRTDFASDVGLQAALGVPITTDDHVVAVLTFFLREPRDADGRLVKLVGDVAADLGGLVARKQVEDTLATERALLDQVFASSPVGLLVIDTDGTITRANRYASDTFGRENESLIGNVFEDSDVEFRTPDGDEASVERLFVTRPLESDEAIEEVELKLSRNGDETIWVTMRSTPIRTAEGIVGGVAVVIEDITERKERERRLRSFRKTVESSGHSIYFADTDGTIEYVNPAFEETTGYTAEEAIGQTPRLLKSGEHDPEFYEELWNTILSGDTWREELINTTKNDDRYVVDQTIAPVEGASGEVEQFVAVNADITDRVKAERELKRHRDQLAALSHLNAAIHDVTGAVIEQSGRKEIERTVCEALADVNTYEFAWTGDIDANSQTVNVRTQVGSDGDLGASTVSVDPDDERSTGLVVRAFRTGMVQVTNDVDTNSRLAVRHDEVVSDAVRSAASIPLVHDNTGYGVLNVYSDRPYAFESYERAVLGQLGEIVGQAIAAAERKRALMSEEVVELEFQIPNVFESLGIDPPADERIALEDVVTTSDEAHLVYGTMTPDAREALDALTDQHANWDSVTVISEEGGSIRFQARLTELPLRSEVAAKGGSVEEVRFDGGDLHLQVLFPPGVDVNALAEAVHSRYPNARFLAKRQFPRPRNSTTEIRQSVFDELTDRQQAVLEAAYRRGYFEWPRDASGKDLAASLEIAPSTFSQHIREAERRIIESLFSSSVPA